MGHPYEELIKQKDLIEKVIREEEQSFFRTLEQGIKRMDDLMASCRQAKQNIVSGSDVFELYDTYGFPLDLTQDALREKGRAVDVAGFDAAMEEQRKPSAQATLALHQAEQWRDKLIADDDALTRWLVQDPAADVQQLRALIRQARKDAAAVQERPGEALRHGKAYREIFQTVKTALSRGDGDDNDAHTPAT